MSSSPDDEASYLDSASITASISLPMPVPYSGMKVVVTENRMRRQGFSEEQFYDHFLERIEKNGNRVFKKQLEEFEEKEKSKDEFIQYRIRSSSKSTGGTATP